ncbi:hypothetical protein GLOTRDRAFT_124101 [Gloeophyllum trabeum ATCC 11539]|uniref:Uncharacterized protein n=1 Tax=Gloeophyllum trabeum (strain ATCC 11539 / FP-39264 / Madison 617) TaxID=670483 RepID=S7S3C9_GLOTA|nr:uncharacterized protein GLOTRDRAFT_124101 [Gloeophyllum trabeum ATCC 11539]EPQ60344.1 hypothetical protein GLOTRDRAFT_124101 [Gloeophyllum trabeum ATCC 11539]
MLGSWFAGRGHRESSAGTDTLDSSALPRRSSVSREAGEGVSQRAAPAALSNPHDAVLAELSGGGQTAISSQKSSVGAQHGSVPNDQTPSRSPSTAAPTPVPETMYDPFTGAPLGTMHSPVNTALEDPEATRDQLWSHLSRIRELQSDIAAMHVTMEKIGQPDNKRHRKGKDERIATAALRLRERESVWDTEGEGETEPELDSDKEKRKAKDEEFDRLADKFMGRKEAIDDIMKKVNKPLLQSTLLLTWLRHNVYGSLQLDELSQAVTTFHSLRTPTIDFTASGGNASTVQPTPTTSPVAPPDADPSSGYDVGPLTSRPSTPSVLSKGTVSASAITSSPRVAAADPAADASPEKPHPPIFLTQLGSDHPVLIDSPASIEIGLPKTNT